MNTTARAPESLTPLQQAGLSPREFSGEDLEFREVGKLSLTSARRFEPQRSDGGGTTDLPWKTGSVTGIDPAVFCLAPGEWLAASERLGPEALCKFVEQRILALGGTVHDVSDAHVVVRLSGAAAPWLMTKLGSLDFLRGAVSEPHCARTRLIDLSAIVLFRGRSDVGPVFDLVADRSYASYLWSLLETAATHARQLHRSFGAGR